MEKYIKISLQEFSELPKNIQDLAYVGMNRDENCYFISEFDLEQDFITEFEGITFSSAAPLVKGKYVLLMNSKGELRKVKCTAVGGAGLPPLFENGETLLTYDIIGYEKKY